MTNEEVNLEYIKQFNPCEDGFNRFIKAGYLNFSGSIIDFIRLDKIPFNDIKWIIFHEYQKILSDNLMREFALLCSLRAVEEVSVPEITYLYDIALLQYISGEKINSSAKDAANRAAVNAADNAAYRAAYYAAYYAAYRAAKDAANSAAEENIQKEILIDLIENGLVIMPEWS